MSATQPGATAGSPWRPSLAWFNPTLPRGIWCVACACLLFVLWVNPRSTSAEGLLIPLLGLLALSAPLGWLGMYLFSWLELAVPEALGVPPLPATPLLVFESTLAAFLGYWQWFVFVPWLWQHRKRNFTS